VQTKIQKWGNSLAVRIPMPFAKETQLAYGSPVDLSVAAGKFKKNTHTAPEFRLEDLLRGVTRQNLHAEISTGQAVGREAG